MELNESHLRRALKGKTKMVPGRHSDGRNLYLYVKPTGSMSWVFIYRCPVLGKQCEKGLGPAQGAFAIDLDAARIKAAETAKRIMRLKEDDKSLMAEGRIKRTACITFEQWFEKLIENRKQGWKPEANGTYKREANWRSFIKHASDLHKLPVKAISTQLVCDALTKAKWPSETATTLRELICATLDAASTIGGPREGMANPADKKNVLKVLTTATAQVVAHPSLPIERVPELMADLTTTDTLNAKALQMAVLSGGRRDEMRKMKWSELDLANGVFDAGRRVKNGEDHIIPLSTQQIAILRTIAPVDGNEYVFAGNAKGKPISENRMIDELNSWLLSKGMRVSKKVDGKVVFGDATVHGFRGTFTTWAAEAGYKDEHVELQTGHIIKGVRGRYQKSKLVEQRRVMMQDYADVCIGTKPAHPASNVVELKVAA